MPQHHHTLPPLSEQWQAIINEGWEQEVLPQLSADYEQQAEQLHALVSTLQFDSFSICLCVLFLTSIVQSRSQVVQKSLIMSNSKDHLSQP